MGDTPTGPQDHGLNFDQLYAQAREAVPMVEKMGNKILDAVRQRYPGKFDDAYVEMGPIKTPERAQDKIKGEYKGDASRITDLARGRIVVQTGEQAALLREYMNEHKADLNVQNLKDRFGKPSDTGFRDVLATVKTENGHVAEFRVEQKDMIEAGKLTHKPYEEVQEIERKASIENRDLTPEEAKKRDEIRDKIRDTHQTAADKGKLDPLLNAEGREKLKGFEQERVAPRSDGYFGRSAPSAPGETAPSVSGEKPAPVVPGSTTNPITVETGAPVPPPSPPPHAPEGHISTPEIHAPHAPEIHAPHGKGGGILGAAVVGVVTAGAAVLNGASAAQAATTGGKTIIEGAVPGATNGFQNLTKPKSTIDGVLDWADTVTGVAATGAAATAAVTSPMALTGAGAAVPAGAAVVAGVAGVANVAVGLVSDGLTSLGLTDRGGIIHGVADIAKSYKDGIEKQVNGHSGTPQENRGAAPDRDQPQRSNIPQARGNGRGAMRSILAEQDKAAPPNSTPIPSDKPTIQSPQMSTPAASSNQPPPMSRPPASSKMSMNTP